MSSFRWLSVVLAAFLLPQAIPASASPAIARDSAVAVIGPDGVQEIFTGSCSKAIRYTVRPGTLPVGGSYDIKAVLRNERGVGFGSDSEILEEGSSYRGRIYPRCGPGLQSGKYTIDVKVTINDEWLDEIETRTGSAKVRLKVTRPAATRLVLRKYPYGSRGWQWTGRLTSGGKPLAGKRVELWWDFLGWDNYDVTKRTNRNGVAHWVSNPDGGIGGINFRLRFRGTKYYAPSQSTVFTVAPR